MSTCKLGLDDSRECSNIFINARERDPYRCGLFMNSFGLFMNRFGLFVNLFSLSINCTPNCHRNDC